MSKISKTICISLNERIYDDKRNMKKNNLQNRAVLIFMLAFLVSSCLKETAVPIESAFSIESSEDKTSPVTIQLKNESYGAEEYEWTFEGGIPSSSNESTPAKVVFTQAGEHKITLRVWNAVEERTSQQTIRGDSAMTIDFDFSIALNDIAPGVVSITNKSKGGSKFYSTQIMTCPTQTKLGQYKQGLGQQKQELGLHKQGLIQQQLYGKSKIKEET